MHPLTTLYRGADVPVLRGINGVPFLAPTAHVYGAASVAAPSTAQRVVTKEGVSALLAGFGPACLRSMPVVAMNSLVRVGMTTYFLNSAS